MSRASKWKLLVFRRAEKQSLDTAPCYFCGKNLTFDEATVDHFFPKSKGGKSNASNFEISCHPCNLKKGDTVMDGRYKPEKLRIKKRKRK